MNGKILLTYCIMALGFCLAEAQNIIVKPYLQNASPDGMTVMWEADDSGVGKLIFGLSPFDLINEEFSNSESGSGITQIHTVTLNSLSPGTKYYYKVVMEDLQESLLYTFATPYEFTSEKSTQLIAISDMQRDGSHPNKFMEIVEEGIVPIIFNEVGFSLNDLEAILIPGDLVSNGGTYNQWKDYFFNPSDSLFPYVPVYPVLGNHEYFGGGLVNFIKYFSLPENGPAGLSDQSWYKDISNVRIIGLNSNSGISDMNLQLSWLGELLDSTCNEQHIDFVFAQLHHPYKSELWTPGELDFTGMVIDSLVSFTQNCNKPSVHFFGHTHGYSRGQSRDHKHLWVNVATAGGAIDNWGEFPNADYEEFVKSQDEYGFVMIKVEAGHEPSFTLKRYSRGDQDTVLNNVLRDEIKIYKNECPPFRPDNIFPLDGDTLSSSCLRLKASEFQGVNDEFQSAHFEIARGDDFIDSLVASTWKQSENYYFEVNLQANDDLTDSEFNSIPANETYFWRVRYRDQNLEWSPWSQSTSFFYENPSDTLSANLILNEGAENGITSWVGDIESLLNAECNSVNPFAGSHNFAVGGVCSNEMNVGVAYQSIDLTAFSSEINAGLASVVFGGYMRNYNGSDIPEMYIEFYEGGNLIHATSSISSTTGNWAFVESIEAVPVMSDECRLYLKGTRNAGSDNDSYFDALHLYVIEYECQSCFGDSMVDVDNDGFCDDIDCNDNDDTIYPGAIEICDGLDNDCDGLFDLGEEVIWTGASGNKLWSDPDNWDQEMVPLFCQKVILNELDTVIVDGIFSCKAIDAKTTSSVTVENQYFLNVDSQQDGSVVPANIEGLLFINGRWEVR